jgi:hypothetical protein
MLNLSHTLSPAILGLLAGHPKGIYEHLISQIIRLILEFTSRKATLKGMEMND